MISNRPHLVPPELAAHLPKSRQATFVALAVAALNSVAVIVQAVALATAVDRSLLHHRSLRDVAPELVIVLVAFAVRAALTLVGELAAQRSAERVVASLQSELVRHTLRLGPSWLAGERPGELSLTATRGLRSLHTYFSRYIPQAAAAAVMPVVLLVWVATRDWLSLVVVLALIALVPLTMIYFGRQATKRTERQWRRLGSLAGRFLQLIEGLPTLRAFGRDAYGRREIEASTEGVREATMRTLRVAFLSALAMDLIAGFGVGFVAMVLGLRLLWGQLDFTTAMAVLLVAPEIFIPLRRAGAEFHASTEGQAAVTRALAILNTPLAHGTVTTPGDPLRRTHHQGRSHRRQPDHHLPGSVRPCGECVLTQRARRISGRPGRTVGRRQVVRIGGAAGVRGAVERDHVGGWCPLHRMRRGRLAYFVRLAPAAAVSVCRIIGRQRATGRTNRRR